MIPTIRNECSVFLKHSNGKPLLRNLSVLTQGFSRVKVRKQKNKSSLGAVFDGTFSYNSLRQRCILSHTLSSLPEPEPNTEPFYIFPIDGFKIMFSALVEDSDEVFSPALELLEDNFGEIKSKHIMSDVLKYTYKTQDLSLALTHNCEIIIYGISYYYAIRKSLIEDYHMFVQTNNTEEDTWQI